MLTLFNIELMNVLLSGDNVLIIALFGRDLNKNKRILILFWSMLSSAVLQLGILFVVAFLFHITLLQALFGAIICYMAFHLLHKHEPKDATVPGGQTTLKAIGKIVLGNLMMSFENEATLISMSGGDVWLAWSGMLITAPLIFFGSNLIAWVLQKYSFVLSIGAILLIKIGLDLIFQLPGLHPYRPAGPWILTGLFAVYALIFYLRNNESSFGRQKLR